MLICRIEVAGPDRRARRLHLQDGLEPRVTSAAAVKALSISEGAVVDEAELATVEAELAKDRALGYLGYRDRTSHEIICRLVNDGYPEELAQRVRNRLSELDLINDVRLATNWAAGRMAAGYGPRRVLQELTRRGIGAELAKESVEAGQGGTIQHALSALGSRQCDSDKDRQRLLRRLVSRGFDFATASAAVDSLCAGRTDAEPDD